MCWVGSCRWGADGLGPCLVLRCCISLPVVGAECHTGLLLWLCIHPKLPTVWLADIPPHHRMLLGYRIVVCVTRSDLYSDEEIFSSSSPSQDRIVPTDTGTKPRRHNTCKKYPPIYYPALLSLEAFHSFQFCLIVHLSLFIIPAWH